jgi:hypothetical protein
MDESLDLSKQQSPSCSLSKDSELHVDKDEDVATNKKDDIDPSLIEVEVKQKPKRIRRPPGAPPGKKGRPPKNRALEIHSVNVSTEPLQDIPSTMNSRTSYVKDRQKMKSLELNLQQRGKPGRKSLEDLREACTTKLLAVWTTIRELKVKG